ncbi:MAG: hypothetical protein AAFU79_28980 [Myxococcota bacterium]
MWLWVTGAAVLGVVTSSTGPARFGPRVDATNLELAALPRPPPPPLTVGLAVGAGFDGELDGPRFRIRAGGWLSPEIWMGLTAGVGLGRSEGLEDLGESRLQGFRAGPTVEACGLVSASLCAELGVGPEWVRASADGAGLFRAQDSVRTGLRTDLALRWRFLEVGPLSAWTSLEAYARPLTPAFAIEGLGVSVMLPRVGVALALGTDLWILGRPKKTK